MDNPIYQAPEANLDTQEQGYRYAGFWIRVLASLLDTVLFLLLVAPVLMVVYGTSYWTSASVVQGSWDVLLNYIAPAIAVVLFWVYKSATPGKMICKIAVIDAATGNKLSPAKAIGRYLGYYVSLLVFCLGFIWVAFDGRKQGWHDKLAGTLVVYRR